MSFKQYLIGDSHATDFWGANSPSFPELEWKTILSPGIQRLIRQNSRVAISQENVDSIYNIFSELEKNSRIFISCTDIDARHGATGFEQFLEDDYRAFFKRLKDITQTDDVVVLDWYSINKDGAAELNTTSEKRVAARRKILSILNKLKQENLIKDYHTTHGHDELDDEDGFCKDLSVMRDNVHYEFANEKIKGIVNPVLRSFIDEPRDE